MKSEDRLKDLVSLKEARELRSRYPSHYGGGGGAGASKSYELVRKARAKEAMEEEDEDMGFGLFD